MVDIPPHVPQRLECTTPRWPRTVDGSTGLTWLGMALMLSVALLTGGLIQSFGVPYGDRGSAAPDVSVEVTVNRFYASLNAALGGESSGPLQALLSPIFVDHEPTTGDERSGDGFIAQVSAMGESSPHMRIEVISVAQVGSMVIADTRLVNDRAIEVAGMTIEQPDPLPQFELLRVHRGTIVERWASGVSGIDVAEPEGIPPVLGGPVGLSTSLVRVALSGADEQSWTSQGVQVVAVESGSVSLALVAADSIQSRRQVDAHGLVVVPAGSRVRLRSDDGSAASVVIYQAMARTATDPPLQASTGGGTSTLLWNGTGPWTEADVVNRAGLILLPANAAIVMRGPSGGSVLMSVQSGGVDVAVPGGTIRVLDENRWPAPMAGVAHLDSDHAGEISQGMVVTVRNTTATPILLTLVSLESVGGSS